MHVPSAELGWEAGLTPMQMTATSLRGGARDASRVRRRRRAHLRCAQRGGRVGGCDAHHSRRPLDGAMVARKPSAICWQVDLALCEALVLPLKRPPGPWGASWGPVAPWMRWSTRVPASALWPHVLVMPEVHRVRGRDVGPVVGLRGVSVASAVWRGASLARPVFGTAMRWSPSGVAFWAYPRAWATAEVRVGAGVGESQV